MTTGISWTDETWNPTVGCSKISEGCRNYAKGERNSMWKGGRTTTSSGYILIRVSREHHLADVRGYAYEHRLVAEKKAGRRLKRGEVVHHVNGDKEDNREENLEILTIAEHRFEHRSSGLDRRRPGEENLLIQCFCGCGTRFFKFDDYGRPRSYVSGHNPISAPLQKEILESLKNGALNRNEIAERVSKPSQLVASTLSKMLSKEMVVKVSRGVWAINDQN